MLSNNVDINVRRLSQKVLDGPIVKILLQAADGGAAEDDMGDALLAYKLGDRMSYALALDDKDLRFKVSGELKISIERALFILVAITIGFNVKHIKFPSHSFSDAGPAG